MQAHARRSACMDSIQAEDSPNAHTRVDRQYMQVTVQRERERLILDPRREREDVAGRWRARQLTEALGMYTEQVREERR